MPNVFASFRGRELSLLAGLAGISWAAYLAIVLSAQSLHEAGTGRHSLLILLALFGFTFACYLVAIRITLRAAETRRLLVLIVTAGTLFRVTLLFSHTIEEIDLYRYLWDGAAQTWFWVDPTNRLVFVGMVQRIAGPDAPLVQPISQQAVKRALDLN